MDGKAGSVPEDTLRRLNARASAGPLPQVLVLPSKLRNGNARYSETDLEAVKIARAAGVEAEFLDEPDERRFLGEYSAGVVVAFAIAVAEQLTVDGVIAVAKHIRAQVSSLQTRGLISDSAPPTLRISAQQVRIRTLSAEVDIRELNVEAEGELAITRLVKALTDQETATVAIDSLNLPLEAPEGLEN